MKKIVIICGLIAGAISAGWAIVFIAINKESMDFDNGMIYGYASMILAFSLIFVGIRNYRDHHQQGVISFGKAFRIGLYITLIASTVYVLAWLVDYFYFIPDFDQVYSAGMLKKLKEGNASQAEIDRQMAEMAEFSKMYKNPLFNALFTYTEILPVGLLISLIAALILKRKKAPEELPLAS